MAELFDQTVDAFNSLGTELFDETVDACKADKTLYQYETKAKYFVRWILSRKPGNLIVIFLK